MKSLLSYNTININTVGIKIIVNKKKGLFKFVYQIINYRIGYLF